MSLAVGETHGNDAPDKFPTPQGLNFVCRRDKGFDPFGVGNLWVGNAHPRVSPTANDSFPLRGTRLRPKPAVRFLDYLCPSSAHSAQ